MEYHTWASGKECSLSALSVELEEASETHLQLLVKGGKLQIIIPSTYHLHDASLDSTEVFLVLTMADTSGKMEVSMSALNEKLEQMTVRPHALHQVLDLLLTALQKLHARSGPNRKFDDEVEEDRISDWGDEGEEEDEEACNSEEDYHSDDEDQVDFSCYDIAMGETAALCSTEYETRERGYLHALAEDGRKKCEEVQMGEPADLLNPLTWFRVASKPLLLTVELQFEVAGMIDERIAAGLGLTLNEPVSLNLEFSKHAWSESSFRSEKLPKYERVSVSQSVLVSNELPEKDPDHIDVFLESSGTSNRHHSFGLEVLFPELTAMFFADLNEETPQDGVHLEGLEYDKLNNKNPFICLALFISLQLRSLPGWCLVCKKKLPFSVTRMRTCDQDLCLHQFEELGLGVSVLDEVQSNPTLVELDMSLAFSAVESSRDVFEPFPGFLLVKEQMRGRSGWFSNKVEHQKPKKSPPSHLSSSGEISYQPVIEGRKNKMTLTLKEVIQHIPAVADLQKCTTETALKKALTRAWFMSKGLAKLDSIPSLANAKVAQEWKKESQLPYNVARFILMTNRLSLSELGPADEVLKPADDEKGLTLYQFVVLHDTPEKEAYFSQQREAQGSFFAFHGSGAENWYSILRNGLRSMSNTTYMSTGAAYGEGIYLATELGTSMMYARGVGSSWPNGRLKSGFQCVAICEVINNSQRPNAGSRNNILVVPREKEQDVSIRYLLVFRDKFYGSESRQIHINGHKLLGQSGLDLLEHYQMQKKAQEEAQRNQERIRMSTRSRAVTFRTHPQQQAPTTSSSAAAPPNSSSKREAPVVEGPPPPKPKKQKAAVESSSLAVPKPVATNSKSSSGLGSRAVMQEFQSLMRSIKNSLPIASCIENNEPAPVLSGTTVTLPDEEGNLSLWRIALHPYLLKESKALYNDFHELQRLNKNAQEDHVPVVLEVKFPTTFPFAPPFVRVLSPRFRIHSGHVTIGGSICMELLTASGWSPACNFESLLVQVVMAFVEGNGRLDLKSSQQGREYNEREAQDAFKRAALAHGWKTT